jgi:hypothetical protein
MQRHRALTLQRRSARFQGADGGLVLGDELQLQLAARHGSNACYLIEVTCPLLGLGGAALEVLCEVAVTPETGALGDSAGGVGRGADDVGRGQELVRHGAASYGPRLVSCATMVLG